uniref:Uncharacterized protein n=1 Tax=Oryza meridionalis TaxID=40149 RepID=A0A0E0DYM6_9ORYZ
MELIKALAGISGPGDGMNPSTVLLLSALRAELDLARAHARQLTKEDRNTWACRGVHGRLGRAGSSWHSYTLGTADSTKRSLIPGDPNPRITAAELCFLHGRNGTATEWLNSLPKDADGWRLAFEIVFAMPGSSPPSTQGAVDRMVMIIATKFAEAVLVMNFEEGEWPVVDKLAISLLLTTLRRFVSKYCRFPYERFRSMPPPPPPYQQLVIPVECSQAMLASLLRARLLCGERLREARATTEHALADAEAEGDDLAAVDVNLVLTFLAARDGNLDDALRRYKAAVQKDPSDSRLYELVVAAALGSGTLTTLRLERGGRGRLVLVAAWREMDARLAAAVLDDDLDLTLPERVQLRLLHHR